MRFFFSKIWLLLSGLEIEDLFQWPPIKLVKFSIINFIPSFPMPENLDEKTTKPEKPEGKRHHHPRFSIKDIENGNEVAVAVFKTNTKTKVAAFVTVIKQIDKK